MLELKFVDHALNEDIYLSKRALFESFFGLFYEFILNHDGIDDLELHNIKCANDFFDFASWNAGGKDSCYAMGFGFHKYFLTPGDDETIETQPTTTFIGYLYHNNKFKDFISFLITFFAWWRNDEGCTCFDPYNHADKFFHSSWAALVDTCKLFYLTSETVYWWQSFRVKYVLDNIPGVILNYPKTKDEKVRVAGYEFIEYSSTNPLTAVLKRKDFYDYWNTEEKKIKKVYVKDYKRVDPA